MSGWLQKLGALLRRRRLDEEMDEELRFHVDAQIEENVAAGMSAEEARRVALRDFGGVEQTKEAHRDARGVPWLESLWQDVRYALRSLVNSPGFAVTAVVSLALGIGANTAIFSLINALLLRPLPVEEPNRLVQIRRADVGSVTNPIWEYVRDHEDVFAGVAAFSRERFQLTGAGESQFAEGLWVSGDFFQVLGVRPSQGRALGLDDDRRGGGAAGPVIMLSHRFARRLFPGEASAVGQTVRLNEIPFEIVGVAPEEFTGLPVDLGFDIAIPIACEPLFRPGASALDNRSYWWLTVVGRLQPGDSVEQARQKLEPLAAETFQSTIPSNWEPESQARYTRFRLDLGKLETVTGQQYRTALYVLMGLVGLVLLIACANVANLMLARSSARRQELSVRMAIGAGRWRLVRQLMTESLLIAAAGAVAGILLARWGSRLLVRLIETSDAPLAIDVAPDLRVLTFAITVTLLTVLLFGLAPALRSTVGLRAGLNQNARGSVGSGHHRFGKVLVLGQVALSLVLLVAAALFVGTFRNLMDTDLGFRADDLLLVSTDMGRAQIPAERRAALRREILERLAAVPGAVAVAQSMRPPLSQWTWNNRAAPEGPYPQPDGDSLTYFDAVTPGYFQAMGIPLLRGRNFGEEDGPTSPSVTVIGEHAARTFFVDDEAIGQAIRVGDNRYEVIGVVADSKYNGVTEPLLLRAYFCAYQADIPLGGVTYEIRSGMPAEGLIASLRAALSEVAPNLAFEFQTVERQLGESLLQQRLVAFLATLFGALALVMAMVGLYGVTSYAVARRKGEIGIRMALGAQRGAVAWLVLREVFVLLVAGSVAGLAAALAAGRFIETLLYGVEPGDPVHLGAALAVLAAATALAAYLPARRAARLDPVTALRAE